MIFSNSVWTFQDTHHVYRGCQRDYIHLSKINNWNLHKAYKQFYIYHCFAKFQGQNNFNRIPCNLDFCLRQTFLQILVERTCHTDQQKTAWFEIDFCVSCTSYITYTNENIPFLDFRKHCHLKRVYCKIKIFLTWKRDAIFVRMEKRVQK